MNKLKIYICDSDHYVEPELRDRLRKAAEERGLDYEEPGCLGACSYRSRVIVEFPGGSLKDYAEEGEEDFEIYPIGDNPVKTIIEDNLPKPTSRMKGKNRSG